MEAHHLPLERRRKSSEVSERGWAWAPPRRPRPALWPSRGPWPQVPVQPPQRLVDSISQASSTSSFSSVLVSSRQEEPKKDYREVRIPDGRADARAALCRGNWLKSQARRGLPSGPPLPLLGQRVGHGPEGSPARSSHPAPCMCGS